MFQGYTFLYSFQSQSRCQGENICHVNVILWIHLPVTVTGGGWQCMSSWQTAQRTNIRFVKIQQGGISEAVIHVNKTIHLIFSTSHSLCVWLFHLYHSSVLPVWKTARRSPLLCLSLASGSPSRGASCSGRAGWNWPHTAGTPSSRSRTVL